MKMSQLFSPTLRETPADAEIISHQYMLRAGFIRKVAAGIYTYLPLGYRVIRKIEQIVREEMNKKGAQELLMPALQPAELWHESGRWDIYGKELMRLRDRHERDFCLGPTHEEVITDLVKREVNSYRQLPLLLYQIQTKYRDEIRPRFGLMRGREFIMKDLYSFDRDKEGLDESYKKMYDAYCRIFERCGLEYRSVEADSGAIGGSSSHEFMVIADSGESVIAYCENCDYAANVEKATFAMKVENSKSVLQDLIKVETPGVRTVAELEQFFNLAAKQILKTLIYETEKGFVAVVLRGDRNVNEVKLQNVLDSKYVNLVNEDRVKELIGCEVGSIGPVNLQEEIILVADREVPYVLNAICGANETNRHYQNVNYGRDFEANIIEDIALVEAGDPCPKCQGPLHITRGIEVGHIFKLGTKYSAALEATFLDEDGQARYYEMGCYGIGIGRTAAAAIEQNHDEHGIIWPVSIAPYHVVIIQVHDKEEKQKEICEELYNQLTDNGIEVVYDDRKERVGVKFKDADLIGFPLRIVVGPKTINDGTVEVKIRKTGEQLVLPLTDVNSWVNNYITSFLGK
ncbi:MAG TPA: proline--tRNA ligase [Clostridia bacterium]|nr:proline--tRNA ligase [Clostridia bacterium]